MPKIEIGFAHENATRRSTFQYFGLRNGTMGALEYVTIEPIAKNTQLCQWYGPGWWAARDIKRCDVGTRKYPAPKRSKRPASSCDHD